jgi:phosphate transport system permease protein
MRSLGAREGLLALACWTSAAILLAVFSLLVFDVFSHSGVLSFHFLFSDVESAGREGGILPVLVSTSLIVLTCSIVSIPIALGSAYFLFFFSRLNSSFTGLLRICLDVLASTPSIVFGLFGSAFFCIYLKFGFSILSGGLTLACMVLPAAIRMCEEGLANVPEEYRLNGAALGLSKTSLFFHVLLPAALPTLSAAMLLSIGRALSETAALLFTSGYVLRMPESLLDSGRSLSIHIYDLAMNIPGGDQNAYRSAAVLLIMLFTINSVAIFTMNFCVRRISYR